MFAAHSSSSAAKRAALSILYSFVVIALCNGGILMLAELTRGQALAVQTPEDFAPRAVRWPMILPESLAMPTLGLLVYLLLAKLFPRQALTIFALLLALITAVWTYGPIVQGADIASKILLSLTHLVIAGVLLFDAWRWQRSRQRMLDPS